MKKFYLLLTFLFFSIYGMMASPYILIDNYENETFYTGIQQIDQDIEYDALAWMKIDNLLKNTL